LILTLGLERDGGSLSIRMILNCDILLRFGVWLSSIAGGGRSSWRE
jgi:hypothetical protein